MGHAIGNYVGANSAQADNHRALPNTNKLAYGDAATEHHMIADANVTAEYNIVREDHLISDLAVMSNVRADHKKTAVTNFGDTAIIFCPGAHCYVFANITFRTNHQPGRPAPIAERLWRRPKRGKRM